MALFKVGEIVILKQDPTTTLPRDLKYNREECTVVSSLERRKFVPNEMDSRTDIFCYGVELYDRTILFAEPHELIRKQPPKREIDTVVSWENCLWQPKWEPVLLDLDLAA